MAGFLAMGFFLGHPFVGVWSGLVRVDSLALTFSLAALWIVYFYWRSSAWLTLALTCLLLSIYTRQTYLLSAPLACGIWLIHKDRKRGFIFMAILAGFGLLIYLILNTITQGGFFIHIVTANVNHYSFTRTINMGTLLIIAAPVLIVMAIIAVHKASAFSPDPFLTWGLLPYTGGAVLTAVTVGKVGSDINYFLELIAALAIWATSLWTLKPGKLIPTLIISNVIWVVTLNGLLFQSPLVKLWNNIPEVNTQAQEVQAASRNGPVLADDRLDLVLLAGQGIYFQPFEYTQLYNAGIWNASAFENEIASHKFPLILIHLVYQQERWPGRIYDIIQRNYTCTLQTGMLVCQP
jgi:hypothetical protein